MQERNKGFTLMELLLSIAIMAIVSGMLGALLHLGNNGFKIATQEENLQSDAQMVFSQIENYVIDADVSINYCVSASESDVGEAVLCDDEYTGGEISHKQLTIYSRDDNDSSKKKIQQVSWKASTNTLYYSLIDGDGAVLASDEVLATNVTTFSADLRKTESGKQVDITLVLSQDGNSYEAQKNIALRNGLVSGVNVDVPDASSVLGVRISPKYVEMKKGDTQQFQAIVYGSNNPSQEVTWSLSGNTDSETKLSQDGKLIVGKNEKAEFIYVTATSVQDTAKSATATVKVKQKSMYDAIIIYKEEDRLIDNSSTTNLMFEEDTYCTDEHDTVLPVLISGIKKRAEEGNYVSLAANAIPQQYYTGNYCIEVKGDNVNLVINSNTNTIDCELLYVSSELGHNQNSIIVNSRFTDLYMGSMEKPMVVCNMGGRFAFNPASGQTIHFTGIIYCPNGEVVLNQGSGKVEFTGIVICNNGVINFDTVTFNKGADLKKIQELAYDYLEEGSSGFEME